MFSLGLSTISRQSCSRHNQLLICSLISLPALISDLLFESEMITARLRGESCFGLPIIYEITLMVSLNNSTVVKMIKWKRMEFFLANHCIQLVSIIKCLVYFDSIMSYLDMYRFPHGCMGY